MTRKYSIWIRLFAKLFEQWISIIKIDEYELELAELEEQKMKLEELVAHDPLTGALSRTEFEERAEHLLSLSKRLSYNNTKQYFSVVFIDLDKFKDINDEYGHDIGDDILINFVCFLESQLRESDLVGRHSGDEFLLLLEESDLNSSKKVLRKIKSTLKGCNLSTIHEEIRVDFSYGVVSTSEGVYELEKLLKTADDRMYQDKKRNNKN